MGDLHGEAIGLSAASKESYDQRVLLATESVASTLFTGTGVILHSISVASVESDGSGPTGPAVSVWDGSQEIPATMTVWDGAAEVAASAEVV